MSAVERIRDERFVAVIRRAPDLDAIAQELVEAGIGVLEFTLDNPGALDAISRWRGRATVLAGTVRTAAEAEAAVEAGAEALVSPVLDEELVRNEHKVPFVPGCFTASEIERAWRLGAPLVKLFPAGALGPGYVRSLLAPLAEIPLLVTGGITAENALDFLAAGAVAVGADSSRAVAVWERVRVA